jgi:hypothetical protein
MSELFFERGLFATLAAALVVPELTTFLIFVFVALSLSALLARQIWSFVRVPFDAAISTRHLRCAVPRSDEPQAVRGVARAGRRLAASASRFEGCLCF